jgi:glucose/arabinose dehydrogenase
VQRSRRGRLASAAGAVAVCTALALPAQAPPAEARVGVARAPTGRSGLPSVALEPVASINGGTAIAARPGDDALYVTTQAGRVVAVARTGPPTPVLDITARTRASGERGLLGLAFSPDGRRLYVHYNGAVDGETVLEQYAFVDGVADPASRRTILTLPQPQSNHNGGQVTFGPDGFLYLGLGDGGNREDRGPGHAAGGNGQSLDTLLGKIIRIDPETSGNRPYAIPADNPFAGGGGRAEIYVYGLRNPWRFSFDRATGDLWIADVGQDRFEEATRLNARRIAGANLGWNLFEGTLRLRDGPASGVVMPEIEASHDDGNCSITGGYVYRGRRIKKLVGRYLYTDYCNGAIRAVKITKGGAVRDRPLGIEASSVSSFGEDNDGELYVLSQSEGLSRIVSRRGG